MPAVTSYPQRNRARSYIARRTLIYHGYIGCGPLYPTAAILLRTLAAYRQIHRSCPQFSIQAQVKSLCFLHDTPYRPYLNAQFSAAYDIYLEILHCVKQRHRTALNHDTPNWCMLNSCPACFYKLEDKPALEFDWLVSIDGNNSLKHWNSSIYGSNPRIDSRKACSDYWLDTCDVDRFKDERDTNDDNWEDKTIAAKGTTPAFNCVNRWCNAGPETRKKMFSVFDESGIFIAACRHRFVVLACDMIRSGELLTKYPLAIIDKLLTVYGKNSGCAYDIGCAFSKTLTNSSLGMRVHELDLHLMVGAFHRHAHNCKCQLDWHPMYIPRTRHTKGEGCEHVFSSSNELARSTRHASPFHQRQTIEEHFSFWDTDKYTTLSNFIWNHYCEVLNSIQTLTAELAVIKAELCLTDEDLIQFLKDERVYLDGLKLPPVQDQPCICYVEVLDELAQRHLEEINNALAIARIRVDSSYVKLQHAEGLVRHIETQSAVDQWWEIGGPEYRHFKEEASLGKYRTALDELERLVVMRLFELSKLSLSGTGKALQHRSDAIRNAINCYNTQATALNPPHSKISWKDIADYGFVAEFNLLAWSKPGHREATTKFFKLCQACKEITRLNVEVCRLCTAIHDEERHMLTIIQKLQVSDPHLGCELQCQHHSRAAINAMHCYHLNHIESLTEFSGVRGVGVHTDVADCGMFE
ncbi:hypothetical protein EV702DRAFT_1177860 [Suillus placidus]|uniref:CxC2-like cysteine cluster KDZ transposase-associated domain-containing protein n=1 Tax=Suillus placidus TaxID=48579 RepID=A0A9P7A233_9AGAM|nr:hypothetical protein EV702DRAFT_1177860 [Suillus placidus]